MAETFQELCDRVDKDLKNKPIKPSDHLVFMREYALWVASHSTAPSPSGSRRE